MRLAEFTQTIKPIKPKPPMTPAQARINGLKNNVGSSKERLRTEREAQRQQRQAEKTRTQRAQRSAVN